MGVPCAFNINNKENEPRTGSIILEAKNRSNEAPLLLRTSLTPAATRVPRMKMNNGQEIPAFGLGTSMSKPGELKQAVKNAIDAGYRHVDCAFSHANESEIGEAIKEKVDQGALIHWPKEFREGGDRFPIVTRDENGKLVFSDVDICDTWRAMEQLVHKGLVRSIGVSNFNRTQLVRLLACATIRPTVNQIEILPYTRQKCLVDFCRDNDIVVTAYSPLRSSDRQWEKEPTFLHVPKLLELSKKYGKSVAQVVLRWMIQRGIVVIPKSVDKSRIIENLNIFDFYLTEDDMEDIFGTCGSGSSSRSNSISL